MIDDLIDILHRGNHSLVVANGDVATFDGRGVTDLYRILTEDPGFLSGTDIADKVVGKGAAALMILGNINSIYADVISVPARQLLEKFTVKVSFGKEVPNIINRRGDGICPVETLCLSCKTPEECLSKIRKFLNTKIK